MAVFRVEKNKNYTTMANYHFMDKTLSWKAKGILSNMLSLPDDWDYSLAGLVTLSNDGMSATRTAIKELEEHGYLIRRPIRTNGKISDWEYEIFEYPQIVKQDVDLPLVENQHIENHTQLNTNQSIPKELKTNEIKNENNNTSLEDEFETLWKMYPRKVGKDKALSHYIKARKNKKNPATFEQVKRGIENYRAEIKLKNIEIQFIKHGSTWFNNCGWIDEYEAETTSQEPTRYGGTYL